MAEIRNAPLYFIIPLKNWKVKNPKRTLFTDANLITDNIGKTRKTGCHSPLRYVYNKRGCVCYRHDMQKDGESSDSKRIKGVLSSLRTPGGGRYPHAKFL